MDQVIKAHLKLVVSLVMEFYPAHSPVDPMDLIGEGNLALYRALDNFDPERREAKFSTFAYYRIRRVVLDYLRSFRFPLKLPASWHHRLPILREAYERLLGERGMPPSAGELSEETGFAHEMVVRAMPMVSQFVSLDADTGTNTPLESTVACPSQKSAFAEMCNSELRQAADASLRNLAPRTSKIFQGYIGLDEPRRSMISMAKEEGISREYVRVIYHRARSAVRRDLEALQRVPQAVRTHP